MNYRDKDTGTSKRYRFGINDKHREGEAIALYHEWLAKHLRGETQPAEARNTRAQTGSSNKVREGSLLEVASGFVNAEQARVREDGQPKRRGTIAPAVLVDRKKHAHDFLAFLNRRNGQGAVGKMQLADLTLGDVEAYNEEIVKAGYSASQVAKRMQVIKAIIDRAGRPEHGTQVLAWNWDARDSYHGKPTKERILPTVEQLQALLDATDLRGQTMVWLGIGLGFGAKDISAVRVGQVAADGYDLRRGKTGIERYGVTPPLVYDVVSRYTTEAGQKAGEPLILTRNGLPMVHGRSDGVTQWWSKLRRSIGETKDSLGGFYTLRHLGATEFGSRPGTSISDMKRWLGHSASSQMADIYMKPVSPEYAEVVRWVRTELAGSV